jgi:hypothetical protein
MFKYLAWIPVLTFYWFLFCGHRRNVITISYTKNNKNNNTKICVFRLLARLGIRPARVSSQNSYQCFAFPQFSILQINIKKYVTLNLSYEFVYEIHEVFMSIFFYHFIFVNMCSLAGTSNCCFCKKKCKCFLSQTTFLIYCKLHMIILNLFQ